tara:strand:+ start:397 stop:612 length:216 start_codon:yes stop_codon:yes gene_type:complete
MNLALLKTSDKELLIMSIYDNTKQSSQARKEIKRRRAVGYSDGTAIVKIDPKAELVELSRVGTIIINGVEQ